MRLAQALATRKLAGEVGIIPYFPVGFPNPDSTPALIEAAVAGGADAIELGVPFSDPLADGPIIQRAATAALAHGVTLGTCLEAAKAARMRGIAIPLIFMGYYNPFHHYGLERFAVEAAEAGVDGCIVPDLPPEEAQLFLTALEKHGIAYIPMIAPTSTVERIKLAVGFGSGFVYCVSVAGVTGSRRELPAGLSAMVNKIRTATSLPVAIGFGISSREHVLQIGEFADIAVIGSAVVERIEGKTTEEAAAALTSYLRQLRGLEGEPA